MQHSCARVVSEASQLYLRLLALRLPLLAAVPFARAGAAPVTSNTRYRSQDAPERVRDRTRCDKCECTDEHTQGATGKDPTGHDMHDTARSSTGSVAIELPIGFGI